MKSMYLWITIVAVAVIAAGTWYGAAAIEKKPSFTFTPVSSGTVVQGVQTTGTVAAAQDIVLAFQSQGAISKLPVYAGQAVKQGQVLAQLDNAGASAAVAQASAALEAARANYDKVLHGATSQQLSVTQSQVNSAQSALDNAQKNQTNIAQQQNTLVANAYRAMMNSTLAAIPGAPNLDGVTAAVTGTYIGDQQGEYDISLYSTGSGLKFQYSGLETGSGDVKTNPVALGTKGLYLAFSSVNPSSNDTWTVTLPNMQASAYVANYNAYQSALQTQSTSVSTAQGQVDAAHTALAQAQANLSLQQTAARPEDVAAAKAQVDVAAAQLQTAQNTSSNGTITAPADGVVTEVDAKIGEIASPGKTVISMISNGIYEIETYVSEADLGRIKVGDTAQATLDAYGNSAVFQTTVSAIDPTATLQNDVQSYKVTLQFTGNDDRIKEGMGANVTITDNTHNNVLWVPQADVLNGGATQFVLVSDGKNNVRKQTITTGLVGVNGAMEVVSGLSAGDSVASFAK